jgi:prepilin-type N-terminal cleavage/methylation domain-containing protein
MNKNITHFNGFTMIELTIVMTIVALLMSLVGPLTIQGYEKIKAKEEQLALKNWIRANSHRSFATGQTGDFILKERQVFFVYKSHKNLTQSDNQNESVLLGQADKLQQVMSERKFNHLSFEPQILSVNTFGLIFPTTLRFKRNGIEQSIDLSERHHNAKE